VSQIDADDLLKSLRQDARRFSWGAEPLPAQEGTVDRPPPAARQEGFVIRIPRLQLPASFHLPQVSWPSPLRPAEACDEPGVGAPDAKDKPSAE
jgi:hypothetical protein